MPICEGPKQCTVGSSGIAFFSDENIATISARLGHRRLLDLFETLTNSINARINCSTTSLTATKLDALSAPLQFSESSTRLYISGGSHPQRIFLSIAY